MEKERIKLDVNETRDIVYQDTSAWDLIESEVLGHWRHGSENTGVFQRRSDGKFFRIHWRDSVKEMMDFEDMNYGVEAVEVFPKKITTTIYE